MNFTRHRFALICVMCAVCGCTMFTGTMRISKVTDAEFQAFPRGTWCRVELKDGTETTIHIGQVQDLCGDELVLSHVKTRSLHQPTPAAKLLLRMASTGTDHTSESVVVSRSRIVNLQPVHDPYAILGCDVFAESSLNWKQIDRDGDGTISDTELLAARKFLDDHRANQTDLDIPFDDPPLPELDAATVGQWCRINTEEYREGEGHLRTQYLGRIERVDRMGVWLRDVTTNTQQVALTEKIPHVNRLFKKTGSREHHDSFNVPRMIITSFATITPEDAARMQEPLPRIGIDFDFEAPPTVTRSVSEGVTSEVD